MTKPGERVQIDVKFTPREWLSDRVCANQQWAGVHKALLCEQALKRTCAVKHCSKKP